MYTPIYTDDSRNLSFVVKDQDEKMFIVQEKCNGIDFY
jgi:hypothetical protein